MNAPARAARRALAATLLSAFLLAAAPPARAGDGWRAEFDAICAGTQDAMTLSTEELKALVARADELLPRLQQLEPAQRKVFTTRLNGCRNLYQFILDTREKP